MPLQETLTFDISQALKSIRTLGNEIDRLLSDLNKFSLKIDTGAAKASVNSLASSIAVLDGYEVDVNAVVADGDVESLESQISAIDNSIVDVQTLVDDGDLEAANAQLAAMQGTLLNVILKAEGTGDLDAIEQRITALQGKIINIGIDIAGKEKIDEVKKSTEQSTTAAAGLAGALGKVAAPIGLAAGIKGISSALGDFDTGLREVITLLPGLDVSGFETLKEEVIEVAKETNNIPQDILPALYNALSAGVPRDNVFDFISTASQAGIAGVTDTNTAVNALTTVLNAYGLEASETTAISDVFFTAIRLGKTNFAELEASIGDVLPTANAASVSFDEVAGAIALLTSNGLNTPKAATALNTALTELQTPTTKIAKAFQELANKSFPDFIEEGGTLAEALVIVKEAAEDTEGGFAALAGQEASKALNVLTDDLEKTAGFLDETANSAGATDEAFQTMAEGGAFSVSGVISRLSAGFVSAFDALTPLVTTVANGASTFLDMADAAGLLEPILIGITVGFAAIAVAATAAAVATLPISATVLAVAAGVGTLVAAIVFLNEKFGGLAAILGVAAVAFGVVLKIGPAVLLGLAKTAGAATLAFLPVSGTVLAIVAAVAALAAGIFFLQKRFGVFSGVLDFLKSAFDGLKDVLAATGAGLAAFFGPLLSGEFSEALGVLTGGLGSLLSSIGGLLTSINFGAVLSAIVDAVKFAISGTIKLLGGLVGVTVDLVVGLFNLIFKGIIGNLISFTADLVKGLFNFVKGINWGEVFGAIKDGLFAAVGFVGEGLSLAGGVIAAAVSGLFSLIAGVDWGGILGAVTGAIGSVLSGIYNLIASIDWRGIFVFLKDVLLAVLDFTSGEFLVDIVKFVGKLIIGLFNLVKNLPWGTVFSALKDGLLAALRITGGLLGDVLGLVGAALGLVGDLISGLFSLVAGIDWGKVFNALKDGLLTAVKFSGSLLKDIFGIVVDLIAGLFSLISKIDWGKLFDGFLAALNSIGIVRTLTGLVKVIVDFFVGTDWGAVFNTIWEGLSAAVSFGGGIIQTLLTTIFDFIVDNLPKAGRLAGELIRIFGLAIGALIKAIPGFLTTVAGLIGDIAGFLVRVFTDLIPQIPGLVGDLFNTIGSAIGTAVGFIGGLLGDLFGNLPELLGDLAGAIGSILSEIPGLLGTIAGFLKDAFLAILPEIPGILGTIFKYLGFALAALPFGIFKIGEFLFNALKELIPKIPGFISDVFDALGEILPKIPEFIGKIFSEFNKGLTDNEDFDFSDTFEEALDKGVEWIEDNGLDVLGDAMVLLFEGLVKLGDLQLAALNFFGDLILDAIIGLSKFQFNMQAKLARYIGGVLKKLPSELGSVMQDVFEAIFEFAFRTLPTFISNKMKTIVPAFIGGLAGLPGRMSSFFTGTVLPTITGFVNTALGAVTTFGSDMAGRITGGLAGLGAAIGARLGEGLTSIQGWVTSSLGAVVTWGTDFVGRITGGLASLPATITTQLNTGLTAIQTWITSSLGAVVTWGTDFVNTITGGLATLPATITTQLNTALTAIQTWITNSLAAVVTWGTDFIASLTGGLAGLPATITASLGEALTAIQTWVTNSLGAVVTWGTDFIASLTGGLTSLGTDIGVKLTEALTAIQTWVTDSLAAVVTWGTDFGNSIVTGIANLPADLGQKLTDAYDRIILWRDTALGAVATWGADFVASIINGIASLPGQIATILTNALASITTFVSDSLGALGGMAASLPGIFASVGGAIGGAMSGAIRSAINAVIGQWNNLSFSIPPLSVGGVTVFPGASINTPNVGYVYKGAVLEKGQQAFYEGWNKELALPLEGPYATWPRQQALLKESGIFDKMAAMLSRGASKSGSVSNTSNFDRSRKTTTNIYNQNIVLNSSRISKKSDVSDLAKILRRL